MGSIISNINDKIHEHGSMEKYLAALKLEKPAETPVATRSEFCQWLYEMSDVAKLHNDIVEAKYYDGLNYFFKLKLGPEEAYLRYSKLVRRCIAIEADHK